MYPRSPPPGSEDTSLLQRFIADRQLEEKGVPIGELRRLDGTGRIVLGVDGVKIIDMITQAVREREKVAIYASTIPVTIYEKVNEICDSLLAIKDCTHMVVFNGIPFNHDTGEAFSRDKEKNAIPAELAALTGLDDSRLSKMPQARAADIQKKTANRFVIEEDVEKRIMKLFRTTLETIMRAPYLAWAQLSALCHPDNRAVSDVFGCIELLAFPGIDRVITNINVLKGSFDMVRKSAVLEVLGIAERDFASLVMVDTRNKIMKPVPHKFTSFEDMCKKIRRVEEFTLGASYAISLEKDLKQNTDNAAARSRISFSLSNITRNLMALSCPVLTLSSPHVVLLSSLYASSDGQYQQIPRLTLGTPLPPAIYYMFSVGVLSPSVLAAFTQDCIVDDWPLVDSMKYRSVAETILPLRVQTLYQLAAALRVEPYRGMSWFRRYNVSSGRVSKINNPPDINLDLWTLAGANIPGELYFSDVMAFANSATYSRNLVYRTKGETQAVILLQCLDLLGYLTHETPHAEPAKTQSSEPSMFGNSLKVCTVGSLSEYLVLLIELSRTGGITHEPIKFTVNDDYVVRNITPEIRLASRILSLIPLNISRPWTGPLDAELAAFSMLSRMMSRALRQLLEVVMAIMFLQRTVQLPLHEISEIEKSLPFMTPVEFSGGVLVQYILLNSGCTLNEVQEAFPECTYLREDLSTLYYFWDMAVKVLRPLQSDTGPLVDLDVLDRAAVKMKDAWESLRLGENSRSGYYQ